MPSRIFMKRNFFDFLLEHRFGVCLVLLAITAFLGWHATHVSFDNTIETYFLQKDLQDYNRFLEQFGTDEVIVAAFSDANIFSEKILRMIDEISGEFGQLPHVRNILSLTTAQTISGRSMNALIIDIPSSKEALASIRKKALADPFISKMLLSPNGESTAVVAEVDHVVGEFDYKVELLEKMRSFLKQKEAETGVHFHIGGASVLDDALFRYTHRDQTLFTPLIILVIVVVMLLLFRRMDAALLPFAVVLLTAVWTYGVLVLLGYKVNVISTIIGPFLLAVAIADAIHVITEYYQEAIPEDKTKRECIRTAFEALWAPCLLTSLTTALGLLSLLSADLVPIRQFGLVAAIGVVFAFIITMVLLPVLLSFLPFPKSDYRRRLESGLQGMVLSWLETWTKKRAFVVLLITGLCIFPAVFSLTRLSVGTNSLDYFRKSDPVRVQTQWIDDRIGGTVSLEFFLETAKPDALKEPTLLKKIAAFQDYLSGIDGVTSVYSPVDIIRTVNRVMSGKDAIPATATDVFMQMLLLEGNKDIKRFISPDYTKGRIMVRIRMASSQNLAHRMDEVLKRMHTIFGNEVKIKPTGLVFLMNQMERYLLSSQIKSFLLALIFISVTILAMLRSLRLGILAMIPNILPIVFTMALMPVLGISLDVGTVMIASVALGLIVDDTVHFLYRFRLEIRDGKNIPDAIDGSIRAAGRPIIFTSIILCLGFLVLVFASFNPIIHFGILSAIVILFALVFDLLVTPALLMLLLSRPEDV